MRIKNEMRLDFPAAGKNESFARLVISAFILPLNPTLEALSDVKTAVSEAVTNAIVHGYGGGEGTVRLHATLLKTTFCAWTSSTPGAVSKMWKWPARHFSRPAKMTSAPAWALPSWRASWTQLR